MNLVLTVLSAGVVIFILAAKTIRPLYTPIYIWVSILIIYAIVSNIYLIIVPAVLQLGVDIWYYQGIEVLIHLEEETT